MSSALDSNLPVVIHPVAILRAKQNHPILILFSLSLHLCIFKTISRRNMSSKKTLWTILELFFLNKIPTVMFFSRFRISAESYKASCV